MATTTLPDRAIVPDAMVIELYEKMLTTYYIDERMKIFVRQGKCGFHASTRGHEKIQIGITMLLQPSHDWFYTYYREKAIAVALGMPPKAKWKRPVSRPSESRTMTYGGPSRT